MAHGPAAPPQLLLDLRAECTRLDPRQPRLVVDLEDLVHPAEVDRDDRALLFGRRLQRADDVRPAAEGDEDRVRRHAGVDDGADLVLAGRVDDRVHDPAQVPAAQPHQVPHPLAVRVHDAVHVVVEVEALTDDGAQLGGQRRIHQRGRHLEILELRRAARLGDVQPDHLLDEGREVRLARRVEGDALDAPAPPLLVLDTCHRRSFRWGVAAIAVPSSIFLWSARAAAA